MEQDIRWEQRFSNFVKALYKLSEAITYIKDNFLNEDKPIDDGENGFVFYVASPISFFNLR